MNKVVNKVEIRLVQSDDDLEQVRRLYRGFAAWLSLTYFDILSFLQFLFDGLEADIAALPGDCAPPSGCLILAWVDGQAVGTVGFKACGKDVSEMVHMFVSPDTQHQGVGRMLVEHLIDDARNRGFTQMRLETGPRQIAAQKLYLFMGFETIPPFHKTEVPDEILRQLPTDVQGGTLYMSRIL